MLAKRVIPVLLADGDKLVKGQRFDSRRVVGHVQQAARVHQMRGVDELVIFDVAATRENRGPDLNLISKLTSGCFMPITVGGGVRSVKDVDDLLRAGADKVAICTAAARDHEFIYEATQHFGSQAIVGVIEHTTLMWQVSCNGGRSLCPTLGDAVQFAKTLECLGVGELIMNCVDRDGMMNGYELGLIQAVSNTVDIPVVACGGAGCYNDLLQGIRAGASAVAAGALFQWTDATPRGAARFLFDNDITVRL